MTVGEGQSWYGDAFPLVARRTSSLFPVTLMGLGIGDPRESCYPLATRPIFMDDNARPHRTRAVTQFLHENAVEIIPWPATSPDLNPIEHLSDRSEI